MRLALILLCACDPDKAPTDTATDEECTSSAMCARVTGYACYPAELTVDALPEGALVTGMVAVYIDMDAGEDVIMPWDTSPNGTPLWAQEADEIRYICPSASTSYNALTYDTADNSDALGNVLVYYLTTEG